MASSALCISLCMASKTLGLSFLSKEPHSLGVSNGNLVSTGWQQKHSASVRFAQQRERSERVCTTREPFFFVEILLRSGRLRYRSLPFFAGTHTVDQTSVFCNLQESLRGVAFFLGWRKNRSGKRPCPTICGYLWRWRVRFR